jgi:RimJ/RimL family protein N-acetyltransferase
MWELDSDEEVHIYLGKKPVQTMDEIHAAIQSVRVQYERFGVGRCVVIEKTTNAVIGWAGIKHVDFEVNGHINYYDLGYRFIKRCWGKGYASEAAKASLQFAWDVLVASEVNAYVDMNNIASRNVLTKTGLQLMNTFDYEGDEHGWYSIIKQ